MNSFPPTLIYTWESKSPIEDINNIINGLSTSSSYSVHWEIEIQLKFAKQHGHSNSQLTQQKKRLNAEASALYFIRQPDLGICCTIPKNNSNSTEEILIGDNPALHHTIPCLLHHTLMYHAILYYAISYYAILKQVLFLSSYLSTQALILKSMTNMAIISKDPFGKLQVRVRVRFIDNDKDGIYSNWDGIDNLYNTNTNPNPNFSGQRFLFGSCLISVGFMERTGSSAKPCLELSHCPLEDATDIDNLTSSNHNLVNPDLNRSASPNPSSTSHSNSNSSNRLNTEKDSDLITYQLYRVASDLLAAYSGPNTIPIAIAQKGVENINSDSSNLISSVESRTIQWLSLITQ
jgi:hypothetical protein